MSCEDINTEKSKCGEICQPNKQKVAQNLLEDLQNEQSRLTDDFPICGHLIDEAFDYFYSTGLLHGLESYADVLEQKPIKLTQRVFVPVKQYPKLNLTGKHLEANENSLKRLQDTTQCKIILKGRNSMCDKDKEEELRQSGNPRFRHLNKDLFLEISTEATPVECYTRIAYALAETRKYLTSAKNYYGSDEKLDEVVKVETETVCNPTDVKPEQLENEPSVSDPPLELIFEEPQSSPQAILDNPLEHMDKPCIISLADKLIKLLDETVLNPNFQYSEEETMMVSNNIDILNSFVVSKVPSKLTPIASSTALENKLEDTTVASTKIYPQKKCTSITAIKRTTRRKITQDSTYSKNVGYKNEKTKQIKKKLVQSSFKKLDRFPGLFYLKDKSTNKIIKRRISNRTTLSRCLKRTFKEPIAPDEEVEYKPLTIEYLQQTPTELVFEYTPRDIIITLLDNIYKYPVLWEFHSKSFNEDYTEALEDLCQIINVKWSLNIDSLKMCRSINRILRFYRYLFPFENMDKFTEYFDKCAVFLPSTVIKIPHARCPHCFVCFREDIDLRRHLSEEHKSLKWPHKCQHCAESFQENDHYQFHKRLPHYVEIFTCEQCNERFNRCVKYKQHLDKHEQKQIEEPRNHVCVECGKKFKTVWELKSHESYHEEKRYKCDLCPKSYFKSTSLSLHLKRHRNELDIICEVCGKGFLHQRYLNDHMDTHNGVQITCKICNLKLRRGNLYRHLRTCHVAVEGTIESTFRAKGHNYKRLTGAKVFRLHSKSSKPPVDPRQRQYDCKICNIPFDRLKFLKDHNKQVHSDVHKIPCKLCSSEFKQKHNLKRHYREKHKLHEYQIFSLVDEGMDVNTVLAMKSELLLEKMNEAKMKVVTKRRK